VLEFTYYWEDGRNMFAPFQEDGDLDLTSAEALPHNNLY